MHVMQKKIKFTREYFVKKGQKGGRKTAKRGTEFYKAISKKGVKARKKLHKPWCAAVIAQNAMLPWSVKCDCKNK